MLTNLMILQCWNFFLKRRKGDFLSMKNKKRFISMRYKMIGIITVGIALMVTVTMIMSYIFLRNNASERNIWNYFIAIGPGIFLSFILISFMILWFIDTDFIHPINMLTSVTRDFAYDTNDKRKENEKRIFDLKYHKRRDELGKLYSAIAMTTRESTEFADDIMKQANTITNMQNGLLMVIAEMVESRDKGTGSHIKKTKAYVEIIIREMKKRGIYQDMITEKFAYNTINAAPLHDVGKIHIPDRILLGTGKLTDEEYEIMKTHTTHGAKIIQYAIDKIGGEEVGYLQEAKNVAEFHHEKWNGEGYPTGLKGEEIPLSARIMAVADVFDAIVSHRSYKEPIPFDEAITIMRGHSGSYFDPLILEAFLGAEEEMKKVAEEFEGYGVQQ